MEEDKYKEVNYLLSTQVELKYEELDNILEEHNIPTDLSKIIFDYNSKTCNKCKECCKLCEFYCYYECLRYKANRDVCCASEHNEKHEKFNKVETEPERPSINLVNNLISTLIENVVIV